MVPDEKIPIEKSAGRIVSKAVCICPPCTLIAAPGEEITEETVFLLKNYGIENINVVK